MNLHHFICAGLLVTAWSATADGPPSPTTPLQSLQKPLPPKLPGEDDEPPAPVTELDSVIVKGRREKKESEEEKIRKALEQKPKPPPNKDLNKASQATQDAAAWSGDADNYRNHPGDPTTKIPGPVGDETGGCGADITKGCDKPK